MTCLFCEMLSTRESAADILHEDDDVLVLLHEAWAIRGHTVVVAKRHVENSSALPEDAWIRYSRAFRRVERAVLEATGADRAILMKLGLMVQHLHLHIYPVPREMTREQVFAVIDGKTKHEAGKEERAAFVAELRDRIAKALRA